MIFTQLHTGRVRVRPYTSTCKRNSTFYLVIKITWCGKAYVALRRNVFSDCARTGWRHRPHRRNPMRAPRGREAAFGERGQHSHDEKGMQASNSRPPQAPPLPLSIPPSSLQNRPSCLPWAKSDSMYDLEFNFLPVEILPLLLSVP